MSFSAPHARSASARKVEVCELALEQEEGWYYIKGEMLRSNVVVDRAACRSLRIGLLNACSCKPLSNVAVDIWSCDAMGLYSGFTKQNRTGPDTVGPGGPNGVGPCRGGSPPGFDPLHSGNRPGSPKGFGPPPENHPPTN